MKRIKIVVLILSLILGMTGTFVCVPYLPERSPAAVQQPVWWGGLYPGFCLPGAMGETGEAARGQVSVKVRFKYLTFLNRALEAEE